MRRVSDHYKNSYSSLWTWLWGRYHVPQNVFLVLSKMLLVLNNKLVIRDCGYKFIYFYLPSIT